MILIALGFVLAGHSIVWSQDTAPAPSRTVHSIAGWPEELVSWEAGPPRSLFQGAEDKNAWDREIRERGWVLVDDGVFHLFYTGYNEDRSPLRMLGHATSNDGITWARDARNPIHDESWVEDMCILKRGNTYVMFAEGESDIAHRLTSTDLIHWTERGPLDIRQANGEPIAPGPRGTPFVMVEDDRWYLFYERGDRGVWLATSENSQVWTNVREDPVLPMGPEPYDRHAVAVNQVVRHDDGFYYAVYHANAHNPWKDWTTCVARSNDLIHWEKYPGNPIVADNQSSGVFVEGADGARYLYTMHPEVRRFSNPPGRQD